MVGMRIFGHAFALLALSLLFPERSFGARAVNTCPEVPTAPPHLEVFAPVLQHTVTHFDPSWFDPAQAHKSPTLFVLTIHPTLRSYGGSLRLRVLLDADTSLGRGGEPLVAFDRLSNPLDSMDIGIPLPSNTVLGWNWEPGGIDFDKSDFYTAVTQGGRVPEMNMRFRFLLTCENAGIASISQEIEIREYAVGKFRQVNTVQALHPGTRIENSRPVSVYTLVPTFQVLSELLDSREYGYPPGEPKIEIFLYELPEGQAPADVFNSIEYARFPVDDAAATPYPFGMPRLIPGRTYVWRARANLRGPSSTVLYSNALYFRLDERLSGSIPPASQIAPEFTSPLQTRFTDDYEGRVMAALKAILGEHFEMFELSRTGKLPAKGQIRLNGRPYSLEELEALAKEFHRGRNNLSRLRYR